MDPKITLILLIVTVFLTGVVSVVGGYYAYVLSNCFDMLHQKESRISKGIIATGAILIAVAIHTIYQMLVG